MSRTERFKKRKNLKNSTSMHMAVDKILVEECLSSEIDEAKIEKVHNISNTHYDFKYNFNVSENEAKNFLTQFKKDFNDERFNQLINDCKKEVISSIVGPFGLGKVVAAYDKTGGNVTTLHNFEQGVTATSKDQDKYNEWQASVNQNVDRTVHDDVKDAWKKTTYQNMEEGKVVKDGYTGKELGVKQNGRIDKDVSIHGEHVTSVSEIEKDSKNHLYAEGADSKERVNDRAQLSGHEDNLTLIEGGMNSSKSDKDLKEWADSVVSDKHAQETGNPDMTNAEYYELNPDLIEHEYQKSKKFIQNEQLKKQVVKQTQEVVSTGVSEGAKMGMQQALGLVITEFFTAVFDEILDIYKNGFSNGFDDDRFFIVLKERIKKIAIKVKNKWKDAAFAFKDGFISGFISNLVTTVINMFIKTGKRVVRIIREGLFSLFRAVKLLTFPPTDMSHEDAMHEAKKLIASGLIISLGVIAEEYIDILIKGTAFLEPFADVLTAVFVGAITGLSITMVVYYIDKKKNDKEMVNALISDSHQKFDNLDALLVELRY